MIKIDIENNICSIRDYKSLSPELIDRIYRTLSFFSPASRFSPAFKRGVWDGRVRCITAKGEFPTGLLGRLAKAIPQYKLYDHRVAPKPALNMKWVGPELRDYQQEILAKTDDYFRGIYEIPTRTGKTYVSAAIIQKFQQKSFLIVNSKESMQEASEILAKCLSGCTIGTVGAGKVKMGDVVVATMQTLYRRPELLQGYGLFIVDEIHMAAADSWYGTLLQSDAYYRFGQSGTVFREDNADIRFNANTGPLFHSTPITKMWEDDVIMKPKVFWIKYQTPRLNNAVPFRNVYKLGIVANKERNAEVLKLAKKLSKKESVLVSVQMLEHLEILSKMFTKAGIKHVLIHGEAENREEDYQDFKAGKVRVAIASRVLNTSVTLPDLSVMINAAGNKSEVELIQKLGRILGKGNKHSVSYYDFVDEHAAVLRKHSGIRYRALKAVGHEQTGW